MPNEVHAGCTTLKVLWSNFHLRALHTVPGIFPVFPDHSVGVIVSDLAGEVPSIQVGMKATVVPPGAFSD